MGSKKHQIRYAEPTLDHLSFIDAKHHPLIRSKIEEQLMHEPFVETKNRKPMQPNPYGDDVWELRFGPANRFRVIYEAGEEATVTVLAIGVKIGNKLFVGGEEIDL